MTRVSLIGLALGALAMGLLTWHLGTPSGPDLPPGLDGVVQRPAPEQPGPRLEPGARETARPMAERSGRCAIIGTVRREDAGVRARLDVALHAPPIDDRVAGPGTTPWLQSLLEMPRWATTPLSHVTAEAGADGRFQIDGLARGTYGITAIADDGARGSATAVLSVDGARTEVNLRVVAGDLTLAGRVLYADGRAFTGAVFVQRVRSDDAPGPSAAPSPVHLNGDGRFVAAGLGPGAVSVVAIEDRARYVASGPVSLPHPGEYVLVVGAGWISRLGRVLAAEDGRPVPGASIFVGVHRSSDGFTLVQTTSDEEGRFEYSLPNQGSGGLRAHAPGFAPLRTDVEDLPPHPEPIELRLQRGATLSGRVLDAQDGTPVGNVRVRVIMQHPWRRYFPPETATTDADGRYEISGLSAEEAVALAEGEGWVTRALAGQQDFASGPLTVTLQAGRTTTLNLEVVRAVAMSGVVLDESGRPVHGAVVHAEGRQSATSYDYLGAIENALPGVAVTESDGKFVIEGLLAGVSYVFVATTPAGIRAHSRLLTAGADPSPTVEIRVTPVRRLQVVVLDATSGAPIRGARVRAEPMESIVIRDEVVGDATTNADGLAALTLRAVGELQLWADADDYIDQDRIAVAENEDSAVVRLERGHVVRGRVLLPDASPAVGVEVSALRDEGQPGDAGMMSADADEAGEFRLVFRSPGSRTIRALHLSGSKMLAAAVAAEAGGEPVTLRLRPQSEAAPLPGTLRVRVIDPEGKPVPSARARLEGRGRWDRKVRDGLAEFRPRERQEDWVFVSEAEAADGTPLPLGPAREGPIAPTTTEIVVRLPPESQIDGRVLGPDDAGVPRAVVSAEWPADGHARNGHAIWTEARTDKDGRFRIGRLGGGTCSLTATVPREFVHPEVLRVKSGSTGVTIRLRPAVMASVTVLDSEGSPVPHAAVAARGRVGPSSELSSDAETNGLGVARLGGLDPSGHYRLEVSAWSRDDVLPYEASPWTPGDLTVRLSRGYAVSGVVRDRSGRTIVGAVVFASRQGRDTRFAVTGADGTFKLSGLPTGEVSLRATRDGRIGDEGADVRVQAGSKDVLLVLDP